MDLVKHAVQPLEDEDEGGADGLGRPVGDGQHLHDVAPQASALHGQGVVGRQLQQGVGDLRQPVACQICPKTEEVRYLPSVLFYLFDLELKATDSTIHKFVDMISTLIL